MTDYRDKETNVWQSKGAGSDKNGAEIFLSSFWLACSFEETRRETEKEKVICSDFKLIKELVVR